MKKTLQTLITRSVLTISAFMLFAGYANAQIAAWNPAGVSGYGTSPWTATTADANVNVGGLVRGSGVTTSGTAAAGGWGGNGWNASVPNLNITFTLEAKTGYSLSLSNFALKYRRSSTGPNAFNLEYAVGAGSYTLISSVSTTNTSSSGADITPVSLTGIADLQNVPNGTVISIRMTPTGATNAGGTFYVYGTGLSVSGSAVLPVKWLSFDASPKKNTAVLNWATAQEVNNKHFEIERSEDGRNFIQTGVVNGAGNSSHINNYTYTDYPSSAKGVVYYRLKQVDLNGDFEYSAIRVVEFTSPIKASIFPNPNKDGLFTIDFNGLQGDKTVAVYDLSGRLIQEQHSNSNAGSEVITMDKPVTGIYLVKVISGLEVSISKLIIE